MLKYPKFLGIHAAPPPWLRILLMALPFALLIGLYLGASHLRLADNPDDKILPSVGHMVDAVQRVAFQPDKRTGEYIMLRDTEASLRRLLLGISLAAFTGLLLGMNMGLFPGMGASLYPVMTFISIVPPLAILPILFIAFGVDELAKVMLIFIGTAPMITRDMYNAVKSLPNEQITKALTLGASQLQLVYRVVMPQLMPRLIQTLRLSLGAAWLFLIASEAIAAANGLGYRIFLVRRYLAMDVIIPYVLWITFLGFLMDWLLRTLLRRRYHWYEIV